MSNYTKATNFATKDALPTGNALKIVSGTEIDTEFSNIETAVNTKADTSAMTAADDLKANISSPTFTGVPAAPTATVGTNTTQLATTAYVLAAIPTPVASFPSGTVMVFHQTAAPTGWTKSTTHNDKALRVVSGDGGGNGGTHDLSSPPSLAHTHTGAAHTHTINHGHSNNLSAAAHTLSTAQMPSHSHGLNVARGQGSAVEYRVYWSSTSRISAGLTYNVNNQTQSTNSAGSGSSHSHGMSGSVTDHSGNSGSAGDGTTSSTTPTAFAPKYIDVIICAKD
jgi:hypothetical protein